VTFPPAYLFFDRLDNPDPALGSEVPFVVPGKTFNDQILGINSPINPDTGFVDFLTEEAILSLADGTIEETKVLPTVGLAYRPVDGVTLRGAYSRTVARPSFREMGYYVSVEPGTSDQTVGNPQLQLSDVDSYDARAEYVFGEFGDLVAVSGFYKVIDQPIESIVVRNPLNLESGDAALFKTFFNNPNTARLWGIELEARKSFDFIRKLGLDFPGVDNLDYLSIGGNFTYIHARVNRSDVELERAQDFYGLAPGDVGIYNGLNRSRRLFGQPEWIVNADISYDNPDWGTTATLAVFAISDVLESAGSVSIGPNGFAQTGVLDRYLDQFYQLDFVFSQRIWGGLKAKMSVKNLTDSTRRRVYDREATNRKYTERKYTVGRDWSLSLTYSFEF
jgi:outer membrane receptor protein involved in Fe transport